MKFVSVFLACLSISIFFAQKQDTLFVFYDLNKDVLNSKEQLKLNDFVENYTNSIEIIEIRTFCDTSASFEYNKNLAERRLKNVESCFGSIAIKSKLAIGETPQNQNGYNAAYGRRAEIVFALKDDIGFTTNQPKKSIQTGDPFLDFINNESVTETTIRLSILFYTNSDIHYPEFDKELVHLYQFMRDNPNISAHIRGHVCCGDDYTLSSNRAFKVYKYLKSHNISTDRLSFKGYSNSIPEIYPEVTEYDKLRNRRVDIIFRKKID